jgi:hypothetical protein
LLENEERGRGMEKERKKKEENVRRWTGVC